MLLSRFARSSYKMLIRRNWDGKCIPVKRDNPNVEFELLNNSTSGVYFTGYNKDTFILSTGTRILGPCAVLPQFLFHWNVASSLEITEASLRLFFVHEPKLEFLIIGKGTRKDSVDYRFLLSLAHKYDINIEVLPTVNALGTFNLLNQDGRYVGAALIPPRRIDIHDSEMDRIKLLKARDAYELPLLDSLNREQQPKLPSWKPKLLEQKKAPDDSETGDKN